MADLWVGKEQAYTRIAQAVSAAHSGDVIYVEAGVYENDFASIDKDLRIVGVDGRAHLEASGSIGNGKGILVTNGDVTLENIEFSGARVADQNGAGIRYESGALRLENCYFHDNENGLLAASNAAGRIDIVGSEFARNGRGDGQTHGVYVNKIAALSVTDSKFHDTSVGHHLKSRAFATEVRDSVFDDGAGDSSYGVDLPNGGAAVVVGNTLIQGAAAENKYMMHYGGETASPHPGTLVLADNDFINHREAGAVAVLNDTDHVIDIRDNAFVDVASIVEGPARLSGNLLGLELTDLAESAGPDADGGASLPPAPPSADPDAPAPALADLMAPSEAAPEEAPLDGFAELKALSGQADGDASVDLSLAGSISPVSHGVASPLTDGYLT